MIAAVQFNNFKALRAAAVQLGPFNLFIGPSGSGKTSLIQALLRLRSLAALPVISRAELLAQQGDGPQIEFRFIAPYDAIVVTMGCNSDQLVCNLLAVERPATDEGDRLWSELRERLRGVRAFLFDHYAMALPAKCVDGAGLTSNAGNLAAVLYARREQAPRAFAHLVGDFCRILPEFSALDFRLVGDAHVELLARLADGSEVLPAETLSQGTLYLLAVLCLAHDPHPPSIVCLEEADRGVHPRMLREVRDALYRLSHPLTDDETGKPTRAPVQVITTTHSPYMLDLFRDHPEEVVLANKHGNTATFERLSERADLMALMGEASLGDLWYSGILGGIPGEA